MLQIPFTNVQPWSSKQEGLLLPLLSFIAAPPFDCFNGSELSSDSQPLFISCFLIVLLILCQHQQLQDLFSLPGVYCVDVCTDNSPIPSLLSSGCAELASLFQAFLAGEVLHFPDHPKRLFQHLLPLQFISLGRGWRGLCTVFLMRCIVALNDGLGGDGFALERVFFSCTAAGAGLFHGQCYTGNSQSPGALLVFFRQINSHHTGAVSCYLLPTCLACVLNEGISSWFCICSHQGLPQDPPLVLTMPPSFASSQVSQLPSGCLCQHRQVLYPLRYPARYDLLASFDQKIRYPDKSYFVIYDKPLWLATPSFQSPPYCLSSLQELSSYSSHRKHHASVNRVIKLTRVQFYLMNITAPPRSIRALRSSFTLAVVAPVSILISSICLLFVTLINSFLSIKTEAEDVFSLEVKSGGCIISLITITSSLYSDCVSFLILL